MINNYSTNVRCCFIIGDKDQVYFEDGFKLTTQDKVSAHVYGLKRAISFVKNMETFIIIIMEKCFRNISR